MIFLIMASLLAFAGSVLVYLASSQQRLLCRPLPGRAARWAGAALEGAALLLLLQCRSPATAVFMLVTFLMAAWSFTPLFIALIFSRRTS